MKRKFLSNCLTDSMVNSLKDRALVIPLSVEMKELSEDCNNLYSSIKNKGLLGSLRERYGIVPKENVETITLDKGDVIYVVNPPEKYIYMYADSDSLPEYMTISATKYEIK